MVTYTVHEPIPHVSALRKRAVNMVFIKEGISWLGLVFGLPWLLVRGLWLEFLIILGGAIAAGSAIMALGGSMDSVSWAFTALNLIVGFEMYNLHRWKLERRGYEMVGLVSGRDMEECEQRFFQNWAPLTDGPAARPQAVMAPVMERGDHPVIGFLMSDRP